MPVLQYETHHRNSVHAKGYFPLKVVLNDSHHGSQHIVEFFAPNWHKELELVYVSQGTVLFEVDGRSFELNCGDALLLNSEEFHVGHAQHGARCQVYAIVFDPLILQFSLDDTAQQQIVSPLLTGQWKLPTVIRPRQDWEKKILEYLQEICRIAESSRLGAELKIKAFLYLILAEAKTGHTPAASADRYFGDNSPSKVEHKRWQPVLDHVEANYAQQVYVADLAHLAGLSVDRFYRKFKAATGKTPIGFVNHVRIHNAMAWLRERDLSVTDIAFEVGFRNVSYFIRAFKKELKCTPNQYRLLTRDLSHTRATELVTSQLFYK